MAISTLVPCPACHSSLPSGHRRCRVCGCERKPSPPAASRRWVGVAILLGISLFVGLAVVAGSLGIWGLRHFAQARPASEAVRIASAATTPTLIADASARLDSIPPVAPAPAAEAQPPMEPLPPAPAPAPTPDPDRKPELIAAPNAEPMPRAPQKAPVRPHAVVSEDNLRKELAVAPEVFLPANARQGLPEAYAKQYRSASATRSFVEHDPSILLHHFPKAGELPIRNSPACQLPPDEAATLGVLAKKLHAYLDIIAPKDAEGKRREPTLLRDAMRKERRGKRPEWLRPEALPAMKQILMAEDVPLRLLLVDLMADIEGKKATAALAERAVYDLSPEVRQAAISVLRDRSAEHARLTLVNALRYPWPPVADHAADALVALQDRDAAPLLVAQLDKPDPAAPYDTGKYGTAVHEIVRVNHVANCLLCHVPAKGGGDPVVGVDPFGNRPVNAEDFGTGYGGSSALRKSLGNGTPWSGLLIRADVQFLRQDFSITFPVNRQFADMQGLRFDFLVRTRYLKGAELRDWKKQPSPKSTEYPQREAVLFALRALTGKDVGPTTDAWVQLYPHANAEAEGVRLSAGLLKATSDQRDLLLAKFRDSKDDRYTEGLANAIPHVGAKLQAKIRETLIERLKRQSADDLRARLPDDDEEIGRAAALACIRKGDKEMVPDLIGLLLNADAEIVEGAHKALQRLTGEDFGPAADAAPEERIAAAAKWEAWRRGQ